MSADERPGLSPLGNGSGRSLHLAMPFEIREQDGKYCVLTKGTGENHGCHPTRKEALKQLAALYANVPDARMANFAGTKPAEKDGAPKSPPKGYPESRDDYADPTNYRYPLDTEGHVRAAASYWGKDENRKDYSSAEQAFISARIEAAKKKFGIGQDDAKHSASFGVELAGFATSGETVYRDGLIFEAGDYPDKRYRMTPEELAVVPDRFSPVPLDLEHMPTVLSGHLGKLADVAVSPDGAKLAGTVEIPKWLDEVIGPDPLKVSATWDRNTKDLTGLALVLNPRVTDAAVMNAYADFASRHNTPQGQGAIQSIHDMSASYGAVCSKDNAKMASRHEASALQQTHDLMVDHGATCASGDRPSYFGAGVGGGIMTNAWDWLKDQLSSKPAPDAGGGGNNPPNPSPAPSATAVDEARFTALEKQLSEERGKRFKAEAAQFANTVIPRRAMPAERETIIALHVRAAEDDAKEPAQVTFGVGADKKPLVGSRVQAFEAAYLSRPESLMTRDTVPSVLPDGTVTLSNGASDADALEKERKDTAEWFTRTHGNGAAKGAAK